MTYLISEETKIHTTNCPCNFDCLKNENWSACSIEKELPGGLIVEKRCSEKICNYSLQYGSRCFCLCYTRREIYQRYKI